MELNKDKQKFLVLLSVFLVSISLFLYQVVLTRIYSVLLWYHYVFLITSFAIFGLGIGGIIAYKHLKSQETKQKELKLSKKNLSNVVFMLTVMYISVISLIYTLPFTGGIILYIILGIIPFILGGYFFSVLFREFAYVSGKLYFADLLGSGVGSIIVLLSLNNLGMYRTVMLICLISAFAFLFIGLLSNVRKLSLFILPIIFILGLITPSQYVSKIEQNFNGLITNAQKTPGRIEAAGETGKIIYTKWNAFSRTDVIKIEEDPNQMVVTIDGAANAPMYRFDGNDESLEQYKDKIEYLPFAFGSNNKTLIIGPGGGRDVLFSLAGGSKDITAVEINTSSIDAVDYFKDYNGNIYGRPEVRVYGEDGRNYIEKTEEKYDIIFLSLVMTSTSQGVGFALSENYIYTVEAMDEYLQHLNKNGKIAFLAHDQQDMSKIVATAFATLKKMGIHEKEAANNIAIFTQNGNHAEGHIHNPMVIIKKAPFTQEEIVDITEYAKKNGQIPIYAPYKYESSPISHLKHKHISLEQFIAAFNYNITPATDDIPYFYNFSKTVAPILLNVLIVVLLGSLIIFVPFIRKREFLKPTLYFSALGLGFMLIEIPLIQKFILYLGHPSLAFTYILASLLIGCGLGSLASSFKLFNLSVKKVYFAPIMVAGVNLALIYVIKMVFETTSHWDLINRIAISSLLVGIQGFFMGMPFPRGIKLLGENNKGNIIPIMWGINGTMSVAGSVISIIISMFYGFNIALIIGAIVYIFIGLQSRL